MKTGITRRGLLVGTTVVLVLAHFVVACVDGVTPDCSGDAGARCGPNVDGSSDSSLVFPEASTDANDAAADAAPDGDARSDG